MELDSRHISIQQVIRSFINLWILLVTSGVTSGTCPVMGIGQYPSCLMNSLISLTYMSLSASFCFLSKNDKSACCMGEHGAGMEAGRGDPHMRRVPSLQRNGCPIATKAKCASLNAEQHIPHIRRPHTWCDAAVQRPQYCMGWCWTAGCLGWFLQKTVLVGEMKENQLCLSICLMKS